MDDMDMAMTMAGFQNLDDQVQVMHLSMSPTWSSATSSAVVPPPATTTISDDDSTTATATATATTNTTEVRRGPWTLDEDILLSNYITVHGEGRWNSLARSAGLNRTGKSCRLRWLNYLRPDVRRGNITPEEQLLILDLHSRWGNRWSKIAQCLPGRTDNEVKNYWRTRVQKHARRLRCDVNGDGFRHVVRHVWMPRLREQVQLQLQQRVGGGAAVPGCEEDDDGRMLVAAITAASAPPACWNYYYYEDGGVMQRQNGGTGGDHHVGGVPAASEARYQMTAAAAAAAMSPDNASSALWAPSSSLTAADDASHYAAKGYTYTSSSAATATTTNDQRPTTTTTTADDDVLAGTTWSELLATATDTNNDNDSMIGGLKMQDFGFGDLEDGLWSLDDLCCLQNLC